MLCTALLAFTLCLNAVAQSNAVSQPRVGEVEFSDGKVLAGKLSLTAGSELRLHVGNQVRSLALDRVREIRLSPEKETLERHYRFPEAGKTTREFTGDPYPVRELQTTVTLVGGETLTGHLYTTVVYVEGEDGAQKVILPAKQTGDEGQTLKTLVYPARIFFGDTPPATETALTLHLKMPGVTAGSQVAALTRGTLTRLEGKPGKAVSEFQLPSPLGKELFLGVRNGGKILVGWPKEADDKILASVRAALPNSEDFFDDRRLLGVFRDATNNDIYSLLLAVRKGKTTLPQARSQPWCLEIYRWKTDEAGQRLMLAGQGYLFRGIDAKEETPPAVELSGDLWQVHKQGDAWVAGEK